MRKVAIYGKGGIGKSTTTQNTVAGLVELGRKVMVVGCDPKADSTRLLLGGLAQKSVLDTLREEGEDVELEDIRKRGYGGTWCVESGGPEPGVGCAGRGIITSINMLESLGAYEESGGAGLCLLRRSGRRGLRRLRHAHPRRQGRGDLHRLFRRDDGHVCRQQHLQGHHEIRPDRRRSSWAVSSATPANVDNEKEMIEEFAKKLGTQMIYFVPRDNDVQRAEINRKTVIEWNPEVAQADKYRGLAKAIDENKNFVIPTPLRSRNWNRC